MNQNEAQSAVSGTGVTGAQLEAMNRHAERAQAARRQALDFAITLYVEAAKMQISGSLIVQKELLTPGSVLHAAQAFEAYLTTGNAPKEPADDSAT